MLEILLFLSVSTFCPGYCFRLLDISHRSSDVATELEMDWPSIVLASVSPRRAELLRQLGVSFKVIASDIQEVHHDQMTAVEVSQVNAYRKARSVAKKFPDILVLGADTLVHLET